MTTYRYLTLSTTPQSSIPIPSNKRQSLYDSSVPLRSNPKMTRTLHGNSGDPYHYKKQTKKITPWVYITQFKKKKKRLCSPMMKMLARLVLSSFSHRPYDSQVLTASTSPNWQQMSLSVSQLQLFLEQLLTDIWVSSPQGSTLKHIEDYIFTLWLQETFYNFYPFSDHSFLSFSYSPLVLICLIFSRNSSKTESEPFPKTKSKLFFCLRP